MTAKTPRSAPGHGAPAEPIPGRRESSHEPLVGAVVRREQEPVGKARDSTTGEEERRADDTDRPGAPQRGRAHVRLAFHGSRVSYAICSMSMGRVGSARLMLAPGPSLGSPGFAALLSTLLPGLGQAYQERWIKAALMLLLPIFAFVLAGAFVVNADPLTAWVLRNASYVTFLVIATALVYHVFVVVEAFAGRMRRLRGRNVIDYVVLALVTTTLIVTYGTIYRESAPWASFVAKMFAPVARQQVAPTPVGQEPAPVWSSNERLNVLVLGIDTRDGDRTTQNTDTMIVMSLDPLNKTAAMLSIPRDIYIDKPGTFQGKINAAFAFGGPDLVRRVVSDLLGIKVHSYALVNFDAFNRIVNGVGGVIVDVKRPVRDEFYPTVDYGVERVNIAAGPQLMFGESALKYARSRHDTNDYSRARRQQDVLGALRVKLSTPQALRTLPSLMDGVARRSRPTSSHQRPAARGHGVGHRQRGHHQRGALPVRRRLSALRADVRQRRGLLPHAGRRQDP